MKKRELEEHVLTLTRPLLEKLYGKFSVDPTQTDRPDAAITVCKPHKRFGRNAEAFRVGIEITTVDKEQDLAYLNDEKYGRDKMIAQTLDILENGIDSDKPIKKAEIEITDSFIYDGAIRKKDKYQGYVESGAYREIILLCFSNVVNPNEDYFKEHLRGCTNYLLSKAQFPFDAVVFVNSLHGAPVRIYKKSDPLLVLPPSPLHHRAGYTVTVTHGPTMLMGKPYNMKKIMSNAPLIAQRQPKPAS